MSMVGTETEPNAARASSGPASFADFRITTARSMDLGDDTRPEPDLMIVRGPLDDYQTREPTPEDLAWVIEVADSSVWEDCGATLQDHGRAEIPVYWLVSIAPRGVEVFSQPSGTTGTPGYANRVDHGLEAELPVILDGIELGRISISKLFP